MVERTCVKCGQVFLASPKTPDFRLWMLHLDCIYESCEEADCRALKEPVSLAETQAALEHWRDHGEELR